MGLICYLSNGYPDFKNTIKIAGYYIQAGCDVLEVDIPTFNPHIDGPKLQKRMKASYSKDPTLESHIETIYRLRKEYPNQRIFMLLYEHTLESIGVERFIRVYNDNAIESLILVDRKVGEITKVLMQSGVEVASYVPLTLETEGIENAINANGFVYLQATDTKTIDEARLKSAIDFLREKISCDRKIYCGVGIRTPEDIKRVKQAGADGCFVGSAVFTIEDPQEMKNFIEDLVSQK